MAASVTAGDEVAGVVSAGALSVESVPPRSTLAACRSVIHVMTSVGWRRRSLATCTPTCSRLPRYCPQEVSLDPSGPGFHPRRSTRNADRTADSTEPSEHDNPHHRQTATARRTTASTKSANKPDGGGSGRALAGS